MEEREQESMHVVSVVTPVAGDLEGLARLVRSLITQSWAYWEMVVVSDDRSCYQSRLAELGIRDPRLRFFWTSRAGSGLEAARRIGACYARGNFLALLETSCSYRPEALERMLHMAREHGACGSNSLHIDHSGAASGCLYPPGDGVRWMAPVSDDGNGLSSGMVFARELIAPVASGGSDEVLQVDPRRLPIGGAVPVLEAVLQEQHRALGACPT